MKETICAVGNLFALSAFDLSNMADNYSTAKGAEKNPGEMEMRWAIYHVVILHFHLVIPELNMIEPE